MSNQSDTAALYARLQEVLGPDQARVLMELLPRHGEELATKSDLRSLEDRLDARLQRIEERLDGMDSRFVGIDQRFEKIDQRFEKIDDHLYDFHEALRSYARTFVVAQTATVFGVSAIVLGIVQFV